jgi:uncharacterized membrane protein
MGIPLRTIKELFWSNTSKLFRQVLAVNIVAIVLFIVWIFFRLIEAIDMSLHGLFDRRYFVILNLMFSVELANMGFA